MNGEIKTCDLPISGFKAEDSSVRWCLNGHNSSFFSCFVPIRGPFLMAHKIVLYKEFLLFTPC